METNIIVALISGILALVGIIIASFAQKTANKASEDAKRVEQIRLKATDIGDELMSGLTQIIISAETIAFLLQYREDKTLSVEETTEYFSPFGQNAFELKKLLYSSALWTTEEIRHAINETLKPIFAGNVDFNDWNSFVERLKENHRQLAELFYNTYLKGTL